MNECKNCGSKTKIKDKFCASCGFNLTGEETRKNEKSVIDDIVDKASKTVEKVLDTEDRTNKYTKKDIADNKAMAVLSYFGPLALLGYFGQKDSKFTQFHAVNGMNLFIIEVVLWMINWVMELIFGTFKITTANPFSNVLYGNKIPWLASIPLNLMTILLFVLSIIGIVYASCGKAKELPLLHHFKVITK